MRQLLADIRSGAFAKTWVAENHAGRPHFNAARAADIDHPIEQVGVRLRALMPFLDARVARPDPGVAGLAEVSPADRGAAARAT
jgi:ketol-acid reductoisomerase